MSDTAATWRIFYGGGEDGDRCEWADNPWEIEVDEDCDNEGVFMLEDSATEDTMVLCTAHKDEAKKRGLAW